MKSIWLLLATMLGTGMQSGDHSFSVCVWDYGSSHCEPLHIDPPGFAPKPEPIDAPAVQVQIRPWANVAGNDYSHESDEFFRHAVGGDVFKDGKMLRWTCEDKARILEHDENNPPKYWCRKVEP